MNQARRYGCIPGTPDPRDRVASIFQAQRIPSVFRLPGWFPPVYDQGQTNACTAHAWAAAYAFQHWKETSQISRPSRMFIYYNERLLNGDTSEDAGAQVRDGCKALAKYGSIDESRWPFNHHDLFTQPPEDAYDAAAGHAVTVYERIPQDRAQLQAALLDLRPVVFGMAVYRSMETDEVARTGDVPIPSRNEMLLGYHCVLLEGWDDRSQRYYARNSWGASWGRAGSFTLPYEYVENKDLAMDFWTIDYEGK